MCGTGDQPCMVRVPGVHPATVLAWPPRFFFLRSVEWLIFLGTVALCLPIPQSLILSCSGTEAPVGWGFLCS